MGLGTKGSIVTPSASELIGKPENIVGQDSVTKMTDAFRSGYITADDIMKRTDARGQAKQKAELATSQLQERQATDARGNQALAMAAQKSKMENDVARGLLGVNGETVEAAYRSIGRLMPMTESSTMKGVKVPDIAKIDQEMPLISNFLADKKRKADIYAGWEPVKIKQADGAVVGGFYNKFIPGEAGVASTIPQQDQETFESFVSKMAPGTSGPLVQPAAPAAPVAPGAPAAPAAPASAAIVQPPASGTAGFRTIEEAPLGGVNRDLANDVHTRFATNPVVKDAQIASTAYTAAVPVLKTINPDGTYKPGAVPLAPQSDYNLMVAYAKILDPNSVVREGEIKLLDGTASSLVNLKKAYQDATFADYATKLTGQTKFTQQERASFASLLTGAYQNRMAMANKVKEIQKAELIRLNVTNPGQIESLLTLTEAEAMSNGAPAGTPAGTSGSAPAFTKTTKSGKTVQFDANWNIVGVSQSPTNAPAATLVQPK